MKVDVVKIEKEELKYPYLAEQKGFERGRIAMIVREDRAVVVSNGELGAWEPVGTVIGLGEGKVYHKGQFEVFYGTVTLSN
jgi:hypothetical protein